MLTGRVSLVSLVLLINFASTFSSGSKCCSEGEVLVLNETNVTCNNGFSSQFYYFDNCTEDEFCEDVSANGTIYKVSCNGVYENTSKIAISKCCPSNMSYNKYNHTCEETQDNFNHHQYVDFIGRVGLSHCGENKVILDYISEDPPDIIDGTIQVKGVKFEKDQFCLDSEITSGKHVIRVCVNNEICGASIPCLRKCCPDGRHYGLNRTCERFFNSGVDWNDLPGDSHREKGKRIKVWVTIFLNPVWVLFCDRMANWKL